MSDSKILERWLEKADDDLTLARRAVAGKKKIAWAACFHSQQSAEKYLKAFLVAHKIAPEKTHDLVRLVGQCSRIDAEFLFVESFGRHLLPFGVDVRYPDEMGLTLEHAKQAIHVAVEVKKFVLERLQR